MDQRAIGVNTPGETFKLVKQPESASRLLKRKVQSCSNDMSILGNILTGRLERQGCEHPMAFAPLMCGYMNTLRSRNVIYSMYDVLDEMTFLSGCMCTVFVFNHDDGRMRIIPAAAIILIFAAFPIFLPCLALFYLMLSKSSIPVRLEKLHIFY